MVRREDRRLGGRQEVTVHHGSGSLTVTVHLVLAGRARARKLSNFGHGLHMLGAQISDGCRGCAGTRNNNGCGLALTHISSGKDGTTAVSTVCR